MLLQGPVIMPHHVVMSFEIFHVIIRWSITDRDSTSSSIVVVVVVVYLYSASRSASNVLIVP